MEADTIAAHGGMGDGYRPPKWDTGVHALCGYSRYFWKDLVPLKKARSLRELPSSSKGDEKTSLVIPLQSNRKLDVSFGTWLTANHGSPQQIKAPRLYNIKS